MNEMKDIKKKNEDFEYEIDENKDRVEKIDEIDKEMKKLE
jgi:hypothetical protein